MFMACCSCGVTFDPELRRRFGVGCREVDAPGHVLLAVEEDQDVSGALLLDLHVLRTKPTVQCAGLQVELTTRRFIEPYGRRVERLSLQLPGGVKVLGRDLRLELGRLGLGDLHAVERAHNLDVALCRGLGQCQRTTGRRWS